MNAKYQLPKDGGLIKEAAPKDIVHRYEKIPTRVFESEYNGVQYVADIICRLVRQHKENASARDIYEELRQGSPKLHQRITLFLIMGRYTLHDGSISKATTVIHLGLHAQ